MARTSAATRARRLLAILHLLKPDTEVPLADIADALGVTESEVAEDLALLACCGLDPYTPDALVPLYLEGGVVTVFGELPALDRAVRLSSREAHALAAALELAGIPAEGPLIDKLFSGAAMRDVTADDIARLLTVAEAAAVGQTLGDLVVARHGCRCVRLAYQSAGQDRVSERVVEPLGLVNDQGVWYLEAYCRNANSLRTFRVDRIRSYEVLDEVFEVRDLSPSGRAFVTEGLPTALVRMSSGAERALREWPGARLASEDDSGTVVEVPYAGTAWIARQVLAMLGQAEVLGPPEVRAAVRELAASESRCVQSELERSQAVETAPRD